MMKNISHKKVWSTDTNTAHVEPPLKPLVKETSTGKSDGDYVKLKFIRGHTSSTSDLYEFRMSLFDHGHPEEFILFVQNFEMNLADTGTLEMEAKVQYLCTLLFGEALRQFYSLYIDVKNTETYLYVDYLLKGLAWYFPPVNSLSKQNRAMRQCMKEPRGLKMRRYDAWLIYFIEYLVSFQGATMADKIGLTEINKI